MKYLKAMLVRQLTTFFGDDLRRIDHALSVLTEAELLAQNRTDLDRDVLVASALLHDVGIKPSEEKHGYNNGHTQELYGPAEAERLLRGIDFPEQGIRKVCEIVGNHHSPSKYDYPELAVLKKADGIVNQREG